MINLYGKKILIVRTGSLGDTVVALPALRIIARAFPDSERWLLRKEYASDGIVAQVEVLKGTGLIHRYLSYQLEARTQLFTVLKLVRRIRAENFDAVVYLTIGGESKRSTALTNTLFFLLCGIWRIIGVPFREDLRKSTLLPSGLYEYEGSRLLRCISALGTLDIKAPDAFDLMLSDAERQAAIAALSPLNKSKRPFIALSIGTKRPNLNDWGNDKWQQLIKLLHLFSDQLNLVFLGGANDRERSAKLLKIWRGHGLNLCGNLSVRHSAAIFERALFFFGHDSGPMHLAAAVGTPCIAVFSLLNPPGKWFPPEKYHVLLYPDIGYQKWDPNACVKYEEAGIRSIGVDEVFHAVTTKLQTLLKSDTENLSEPAAGTPG